MTTDELTDDLNEKYREALVQRARQWLGDEHRAEDMVQEMLIKYAKQAGTISNPRAWAFKVVHNLCKNELRSKNRVRPLADEDPDGDAEDPSDTSARSEFQDALADCIGALLTEQRTILQMRLSGQTQTEIAKGLKKSNTYVSRVVTASNDSLRDCLQGKGFVEQL